MHASTPEGVLPLAPLQEGLLFHSLYEREATSLYLTQTAVRLTGPLSQDRLRRAATALLSRHDNLRVRFRFRRSGEPVQVIDDSPEPEWHVLEAPDAGGAEQAIEADWRRGMDVGAERLLRFTLVRVAPAEHVLLITAHHLLMDGWSEMLLLRELIRLYVADGDEGRLPPSPAFRDYLGWLAKQDRLSSEARWQEVMSGFAEPTVVAPVREHRAAAEPVEVSVELSEGSTRSLREAARSCGCTPNTLVQAAWALMLSRHLSRDDVAFGTTVTVRPPELPGSEELIGLLINTVPVRVVLRPGDTFRDVMTRIREQRAALLDDDYLGLTEIQRLTGSASALFDTNVVFDNFPMNDYDLGVDSGELILRDFRYRDTSHYPLTLVVEPRERMELRLRHQPELFPGSLARGWARRLARLLELIGSDPSRCLDTIDLLDEPERRRLLVEGNDTGRPIQDSGLAQLFEAQVALGPGKPALSCDGVTLTYAELNARANRLACLLVEAGAGPECRVGIHLPRSIDAVVAMLATVKAGAAYVPVDPRYPAERIAFMIDDAAPQVVVTNEKLSEGVAGCPALVLDAPGTMERLAGRSGADLTDQDRRAPWTPRAAAYVVYTSGSTGRPKGVVVEGRALSAYLQRSRCAYPEAATSSVVHTSLSFDLTVTALFTPLVSGGHVTLADLDGPAPAIPRQPAFMKGTPSHLALFGELPPECSPSGRLVLGGELLTGEMLRSWRASHPHATVLNVYGATEATVNSTEQVISPGDVLDDGPIPVGRPFWNTRVYVLDQRLRPVPPETTGEIYLAGVQLARGYLGRPGLTAQRFVADPYGPPGARMYRTGDLGRWTDSGLLQFAGRADAQIKVRGHRVEPGEIESILTAHPCVAQAKALLREDREGDPRLVAYVVAEPGRSADPELLRRHLAQKVPEYMVPAALIPIDRFPRTVNGKLDRAALPAPELRSAARTRGPRTPQEEVLCGLFAEALGVPDVGVHDDFFALGGHSLLAIRLISRARSIFGRELTIRALFESPTVAALAARLDSAGAARTPVTAWERGDKAPLSAAQRSLWILEQTSGPSPTYNVPIAARLSGPLDRAAIRAALTDVVARHESLRTIYEQDGAEVWQRVLGPERLSVPFDVVDCDPATLRERLDAASRYCFDVGREAPVRGWLFAVGPEEHVLLILVHHIACDGPANLVLAQDLVRAYAARAGGRPPAWRPPSIQYPDFAMWQREVLGDEKDGDSLLSRQLQTWKRLLDGLPEEIRLPRDRARKATPQSPPCGSVHFEVPADLHDGLMGTARAHGATLFMTVQAAVAILLNRLGAGDDIPVGIPVTGRTDEALATVVGYFINSLVLRNDLSGDPTVAETLRRIRDFDLAAFGNQDLPLEAVVEALNPPRVPNRTPLFQVRLVFNEDKERAAVRALQGLPGLTVREEVVNSALAKFDLLFRFVERGDPPNAQGGLDCVLEYNADLFEDETARAITRRLLGVLRTVAGDAGRLVSDIDVLLPEERDPGRAEETEGASVTTRTLPELFEESVRAHPGRPALSCDAETLSYAELNARANRLARHLVEAGVGAERTAAVLLPRGIDAVVAMLATAKAGGAYVPIDPGYPAERIAFMLADAAPRVVLTHAGLSELVPAGRRVVLDAPGTRTALAEHSSEDLTDADRLAPLRPGTPVYVIYTSGSTGRPKGVVVEHRSVGAYLTRAAAAYPDTAGVALVHTSLSFDLTVTALFTPLVGGGHVVLGELDEKSLTGPLRPTFMKITPSHLTLLDALPDLDLPAGTLVIGGEALFGEALRGWRARHPGSIVVNAYGPTELTVNCADHLLEPGTEPPNGPVPIGRPFAGARAHVLDDRLREVPAGVVGELYVSGVPLARGYLGRPDLTAERFVADPLGPPGTRMYRTGDLVRRIGTGELEFAGRADSQVKLRGHRIELGEVETGLAAHPEVARAAAMVREDQPGDRRLVAYVVARPGGSPAPETLLHHLARRLPDYMVPSAVVVLDRFPHTVNGKLDRRALPAPQAPDAGDGAKRAPSTPAEEVLCGLFAQVLGLPEVGVDDDFFALGGHSLLAIRLVAKARAALDAELTIASLFTCPTVAGLAADVESRSGRTSGSPRPRLRATRATTS